jgi:ABC-type multidrug transport system ATPase subunit
MVAAIRMEGLARSFRATVAPLDLAVAQGEVLGCVGPGGAGMSTTVRCLLGMPGARRWAAGHRGGRRWT